MSERIHECLALRPAASSLFKDAAFQNGDVVADFDGIRFVSRGFAQEYLACKSRQRHSVTEVNMPEVVEKMFEVVKNAKPRAPVLRHIKAITMKV